MLKLLIAVAVLVAAIEAQDLGSLVAGQFGKSEGGENPAFGGQPAPASGAEAPVDKEEDCECVPYYQCVNGTIIKNGIGLIDIRRPPDGPCENYLDVCCTAPNRLPNRTTLPPHTTPSYGDNSTPDHHQPSKPDNPHHPNTPDHPHQPSTPDHPRQPDHPHQPSTPDHPHQPSSPDHPHQPSSPDHPHQPSSPDHPHQPSSPDHPHQPSTPDHTHQPSKPDHPHPHEPDTSGTPVRAREGGCGHRHPDGVGFRIVGDEDGEAQFGEFPWMVAVLHEEVVGEKGDEKLNVYKCGGSLIHPHVVLTAAHCVYESSEGLKVRAGEWDTQTKNEVLPHQDRAVARVAVHPDFQHDSLYNDVALLFLAQPMELAENVDVVCLPQPGHAVEHGDCLASGWGKDVFGKEGRYQVILKRVEVPMVPRAECEARLRKTRLGNYFELHESFVCAGGVVGRDTCKGDGGGPLVCPLPHDSKRYQQVGIVAWGIGCGYDTPAVYANVAHEREWVDRTMAANDFDPRYYTY